MRKELKISKIASQFCKGSTFDRLDCQRLKGVRVRKATCYLGQRQVIKILIGLILQEWVFWLGVTRRASV